MNWPKYGHYADYAYYTDYAEYAQYAKCARDEMPKKNIFLQDGFPYMLGKPKMKKVFFRLTEFFRDYAANWCDL